MPSSSRHTGDFCSAISCTNARLKEDCCGTSFFKLPHREEERCRVWIQNMRRADLLSKTMEEICKAGYKLCSTHLEDSQFNVPSERKRLIWNAVPTLFRVPNPPAKLGLKRKMKDRAFIGRKDPNVEHVEDTDPAPLPVAHEGRLVKKLKVTQNKLYRTEQKLEKATLSLRSLKEKDLFQRLSDCLSPVTADFVKTQIIMFRCSKKGRRWSEEDKALAFKIFHASSKAYSILRNIFALPSVSTLKQSVRRMNIYPGFSDNMIALLAQKVKSLPPGSTCCSVVFDEMCIKEFVSYNSERDEVEGLEDFGHYNRTKYVANHATVFLIRGLMVNWKQAIGYFLSSGPISGTLLSDLIQDCVRYLTTAGLDVKCVVADQGSNNRFTFKRLGASDDQPFFLSEGKEVFVFYDPPHLIKNIRNNLKKCGFQTADGNVTWQHIADFYSLDKENHIRMAPKLTDKHIYLPPFASLRVKYATQVLSHSVAAGIAFMGRLTGSKDALETAVSVERFDQLFNAFNSGHLSSKQKMGHALTKDSDHVTFFLETLDWPENLNTLPPKNKKLPCLSGWKISVKALLMLWEDLRKSGFSFLLTERLNQDCIENFFSRIRGHVSRVDNPCASEFRSFLHNSMVNSLFHHSVTSNCKEDSDRFLLSLQQIAVNTNAKPSVPTPSESPAQEEATQEEDLPTLSAVEENVLTYIGGFIVRKLVKAKVCDECQGKIAGSFCGSDDQQFLHLSRFPTAQQALGTQVTTLFCF